MKFDVIIANPPYQAPKAKDHEGRGRSGTTLWDKFVVKAMEVCKPNGYLCAIHPSKWRKPDHPLWNILKSKSIKYLEIHDFQDGVKTFGCQTRYDWYILKNTKSNGKISVKDQDGVEVKIDNKLLSLIPNCMIGEVSKLLAHDNDEKVEIIYSSSIYDHRKSWMCKVENQEFKYPCIYSVKKNGDITCYYSKDNSRGHFNVPKVIIPSGHFCSVNVVVDNNGIYGMTEFAKGIVDSPKNLNNIAKALRTERFKKIALAISTATTELDRIALSYFRKDFWKEFVDEDGNEI